MRIISGKHKGRRIVAPKKLPVRPTTDRAKEGLFNILNNLYSLEGIAVLDLFSGTGNMAFEFASRGAQVVTAVDAHKGCALFIEKTRKELAMEIKVVKSDAFQFLMRHSSQYDIIFADPPYTMSLSDFMRLPELIFTKDLLKEDGRLILEHGSHTDLDRSPYLNDKRQYGNSVFSFFTANIA
ncbi:MAG: RsmD family RNA methyltransferase [Bacteroidota bacterium]